MDTIEGTQSSVLNIKMEFVAARASINTTPEKNQQVCFKHVLDRKIYISLFLPVIYNDLVHE